jgi:hypothetical protein
MGVDRYDLMISETQSDPNRLILAVTDPVLTALSAVLLVKSVATDTRLGGEAQVDRAGVDGAQPLRKTLRCSSRGENPGSGQDEAGS